ncbi:hypothetical protein V6N12_046073 [Hibiscus sabdariffa]|uniref:Endonuclease/exonuclease/phosphatase domain-containing protein n=1 Tax=Hibiscus sabdariffa TaxID=183260 RepID=A0ABR2G4K1_9ROSI
MICFFWNCRGVASANFFRHFRNFVCVNQPHVIFLIETQISGDVADSAISKFGFPNLLRIEARGFSGRIWMLWRNDLVVDITHISIRFLNCHCRLVDSLDWVQIMTIYASPIARFQKLIWESSVDLDPGADVLWLLGGDFNAIIRCEEHLGDSPRTTRVSKLFLDFIFDISLIEVDYVGSDFTWHGGSLLSKA